MRPLLRHISPDRIEIRQGGGCLTIFGLPFFGAGVFVLLACLGLVPMTNGDDVSALGRLGLTFMGLAFTGVGGVLSFGRAWTTVDGTRREVRKQWGLIVPMHSDTRRVDDYTAVIVQFVAGDSDSADSFPVSLLARTGHNQKLCSSTQYADARACAIAVAELLRFDFEDATSDHPVRLSPGQANMPLQQRLQLEGRENASMERPAHARSKIHQDQGTLRIIIPTPRTHPVVYALTLIPIAMCAWFVGPLSRFFDQTHTPDPIGLVFLAFLILFFGMLPAITALNGFLRSRRGHTIVTASIRGIDLQERGAWKTGPVNSLAAADVLDIDFSTNESVTSSARQAAEERVHSSRGPGSHQGEVGPRTERLLAALSQLVPGRGLTVKTRQGLTTFGQGLADDEIRYLHSMVRRALAGDSLPE